MTPPQPILLDALRRWQVPNRAVSGLLELRETPPVSWMRTWLASRQLVALLSGSVGTGKTVAACVVLLEHFREVHPFMSVPGDLPPRILPRHALFVPMAELASLSLWDPEDRSMRGRAERSEFLILDDLGTERGDGAAAVQALVSARVSSGLRTVLTTNLGLDDFAVRYGARVMDRIRGDGSAFRANGPSLRGQS